MDLSRKRRLAWPGYKMQVADAESNLYYVDLPTDVIAVIFNNTLNGGERTRRCRNR